MLAEAGEWRDGDHRAAPCSRPRSGFLLCSSHGCRSFAEFLFWHDVPVSAFILLHISIQVILRLLPAGSRPESRACPMAPPPGSWTQPLGQPGVLLTGSGHSIQTSPLEGSHLVPPLVVGGQPQESEGQGGGTGQGLAAPAPPILQCGPRGVWREPCPGLCLSGQQAFCSAPRDFCLPPCVAGGLEERRGEAGCSVFELLESLVVSLRPALWPQGLAPLRGAGPL